MTGWKIEQHVARLVGTSLAGTVDLRRPEAGLHDLTLGGKPLGGQRRLLAVGLDERNSWEPNLAESYARGADLVATYPQTDKRPYRMQAYWRVVDFSGDARIAACLELQTSINTDLLDTAPVVEAGDVLGEADVVMLGDMEQCTTLVRPHGVDWSYVRIVHPVDRDRHTAPPTGCVTDAAAGGTTPAHLRLFGRHLEKGVIMRARVRGAIIAREHDEAAAVAIFRDFLHAPLPLTT